MRLQRTFVGAVILLGLATTKAKADDDPGVIPIGPPPQGGVYGVLSASWWQWATQAPTPVNPLIDTTGVHCGTNQKKGVWFLAGTPGGGSITRNCTIPSKQLLFFPLANTFYGAFLSDPPATRTEKFIRAQTNCIEGAVLTAKIDGKAVVNPSQYHEQSVLFSIQLPSDNIFGLTPDVAPKLLLQPSADQGYYLLLAPLAQGKHTIQFTSAPPASAPGSCVLTQSVTYHLTITP